jgi:hypothetical protein
MIRLSPRLISTSLCLSFVFAALPGQAQDAPDFKLPPAESLPVPKAKTGWLLPISGPLGRIKLGTKKKAPNKRYDVSINMSDTETAVAGRLDQLVDAALARDEKTKVLDNAVRHYRKKSQVVIAESKDAMDYLVPFRGFAVSSEAGDVILGEQLKLKSKASAEYARQKHVDETHVKLVSSMMQVAMGLGMNDRTRGEQVSHTGYEQLKALAGEEEAQKTMQMFSAWTTELTIPESVYKQADWDVTQKQELMKQVMAEALDADPIIHQIKKRIHKYNQRSNFSRASAKVIQTTLGVASLTPSFVGPAAKAALVSYVMATGGPEQYKLLKQLYLDKRFESRWKVLNEEAHLALDNYQIASLTRNPVLMACSESLVGQMTNPDVARRILGASVLSKTQVAGVSEKIH